MKVVIPDLVSNSYFPAIAAVEMGFFKQEGLDAELELIYPVGKCYEALRDGKADFVGGSSHSAPTAFPEWQGVKFLGALAQHTYWFLIMRADLKVKRGDVSAVKGKRIGAAPLIDIGLKRAAEGIRHRSGARQRADRAAADAGQSGRRVVRRQRREGDGGGQDRRLLGQRHGRRGRGASAASARWCWTRGAATAREPARLHLRRAGDARRPGGEDAGQGRRRGARAGQDAKALKADPKRATKVGEKWFPAFEASLIATLVERDLPYYDPAISKGVVRQHVQVRADRRPDQGRRQVRGRGGDAVQQSVEGVSVTQLAPTSDATTSLE